MRLKSYVLGWWLSVSLALAARTMLDPSSAHGVGLAVLYALATALLLGHAAVRYRQRLEQFLRTEHEPVWTSLSVHDQRRVSASRLLGWLLQPDARPDPELRAARTTGAWLGVMAIAWLISTPALCLVLALHTG